MSYKLPNEYKQLKRFESTIEEMILDNIYRNKGDRK